MEIKIDHILNSYLSQMYIGEGLGDEFIEYEKEKLLHYMVNELKQKVEFEINKKPVFETDHLNITCRVYVYSKNEIYSILYLLKGNVSNKLMVDLLEIILK